MSYCRFRNTLKDLRECEEAWEEDDLDDEELKARDRMLEICKNIVRNYGGD